jgi:hypothetical protein
MAFHFTPMTSGQAHEGMTTAPQLYVESVTRFLIAAPAADERGALASAAAS